MSSIVLAIPNSLTLQGKLTDLSGSSQQGVFNFTFKIYDAYTGGNVLHQIINKTIKTDSNGVYDVILHNLSGLNFSDQYYLGIAVQGDNESKPRINLTSSPYSFRANISEDLNKENKYEVAVFNITGNLTVGQEFADVLTITTGRLNISDGNIISAGNLTIAEKITFGLGQIIDNLVSGFLRISGGLNVTGNVSIAQDTLFVDNTSSRVGIGTATPLQTLVVVGTVNITDSLNVSGTIEATTFIGDGSSLTGITTGTTGPWNASGTTLYLNDSSALVGIGTTSPATTLDVVGNITFRGNLNVTGSTYFGTQSFTNIDASGNIYLSATNPMINMSGPTIRKSGNNIVISD